MLHTPTPAPSTGARMATLSALLLSVALTACGGGGGSDDDAAPGPAPAPAPVPAPPAAPPLAAGTAAVAGDWVSTKLCVPIGGGRSAHQMVRIVEQSATEPPRVLWRLKSLRGLSHEVEQVFP